VGRALIEFLNFHLIPGIVLGSIYALGAIGISLTFGILRFANFGHGETMTLGVYFTWTLIMLTGWHPLALLPVAMALTSLVVLGIDRVFYRPLRASPAIILVIASFGMMLMMRSVIQFGWGVKLRSLAPGIQRPYVLFDWLRISPKHILIVAAALILMILVHLVLTRTKIGKAMRAMADSPELARLTGIDTEKVIRATWVVGACLATAAGVFLALDSHVETMMGFKVLLPLFASAILGGIGSAYGAMAGGLVIGIAEELSTYPWLGDGPLLEPGYKAGVAFAIMVAMLILRPSGLFRGRVF
jgi:branched-chain amino acid transport system permease protein